MNGKNYSTEELILREAEQLLRDMENADAVPREAFEHLASGYRKLHRQTNKLIKISDKQQQKLSELNEDLTVKNRLLEDRELHLATLVEEKTRKVERVTLALVTALENANSVNDHDTGSHLKRVSLVSGELGRGLGCSMEFVSKLELYASLHDIGKVGIPDSILKKPGKLDNDEYALMKEHVEIGYRILQNATDIDTIARNIILYHHEKWDGSGYIKGLQGDEIPLEAQIVSIADVYDALVSSRAYKPAYTHDEAMDLIVRERGRHFSPEMTDAFMKKAGVIHSIHMTYRD